MAVLKFLKRSIDRIFFLFLHTVLRARAPEVKKLLVVRTDGIGDLIYFHRYRQVLKRGFPDYKLYLVCRTECRDIAEIFGLFDRVIPFAYMKYRWNYFYRLRILYQIRLLEASSTIYASYYRQHIGDEMTLLSGAPKTIAFQGNDEIIHPQMRAKNDSYYTNLIQTPEHIPWRVKYQSMFRELGIKGNLKSKLSMPQYQGKTGIFKHHEPYLVIGPGASTQIKRWPPERFAKLGDTLSSLFRTRVILCGNRNETPLLSRISDMMSQKPLVVTELSLREVTDLIRSARFYIGNDSGLLHLAASLGTPSIGILGGGHFSEYFPYGSVKIVFHKLPCYECDFRCPYPEPYCITNISVDDVIKEVKKLLE